MFDRFSKRSHSVRLLLTNKANDKLREEMEEVMDLTAHLNNLGRGLDAQRMPPPRMKKTQNLQGPVTSTSTPDEPMSYVVVAGKNGPEIVPQDEAGVKSYFDETDTTPARPTLRGKLHHLKARLSSGFGKLRASSHGHANEEEVARTTSGDGQRRSQTPLGGSLRFSSPLTLVAAPSAPNLQFVRFSNLKIGFRPSRDSNGSSSTMGTSRGSVLGGIRAGKEMEASTAPRVPARPHERAHSHLGL